MAGKIIKGDPLHGPFQEGLRVKKKGTGVNPRRRFKGPGTSVKAPTPGPMTGGAPIITEGPTQGLMW